MIKFLCVSFLMILRLSAAFAEESVEPKEKLAPKSELSDILEGMGYPELQVVPRATERLAIEAKSEDSSFVFTHWPIEISGLATLAVGFTAKGNERNDLSDKQKSDADTIASITTTVGAAWLVGGAILGAQRPYRTGERTVTKYSGKDERSTLMRERLAEEAMERPARVMRVLQTVALVTNVTVNGLAAINSNDSGRITAGLGVVLAFLPLMFEDHNIEIYEKQIEYKRKIYAPLKSASLQYDAVNKTYTPMSSLLWIF